MPPAVKPLYTTGNSPGGLRHGCTGFSIAAGEVRLGLVDGLFALAIHHPICVCAPLLPRSSKGRTQAWSMLILFALGWTAKSVKETFDPVLTAPKTARWTCKLNAGANTRKPQFTCVDGASSIAASMVTHARDSARLVVQKAAIGADNGSHAVLLSNPLAKHAADTWAISPSRNAGFSQIKSRPVAWKQMDGSTIRFNYGADTVHLSQWNRPAFIE